MRNAGTVRTARTAIAAAVAGILAAGCSTMPEQVAELEQARQAVTDLRQNPGTERFARTELREAESALNRAEQSYEEGDELAVIQHEAYLARGHAQIGEARIGELAARENIEDAELERSRVLEDVRAQQAREARLEADVATERAEYATERAEQLQSELETLQAESTERGLVLTLGDVLFDTAEANLKPGANSTIERLAEFLDEYPERRLLIEGHTDARGSETYNKELSERRAEAVRTALMSSGVSPDRVRAVGLGEGYPVASNETAAGRQENRRVEVIISTEGEGDFPRAMDGTSGH